MAVNTSIGHGSTFARGNADGPPETYTDIGEVISISGPSLSRDVVDATHMGSTEKWREFIAGLKDGGEVTIECNFDPDGTDVTNWLSDINTDSERTYQITFPDTTEWLFEGIMTALEVSDPLDDKMTATATYKVTGKPTFIS